MPIKLDHRVRKLTNYIIYILKLTFYTHRKYTIMGLNSRTTTTKKIEINLYHGKRERIALTIASEPSPCSEVGKRTSLAINSEIISTEDMFRTSFKPIGKW